MEFLGREGNLLFFDEVMDQMTIGAFLVGDDGEPMKIVYIDRDEGEVGCIPATKKELKKIRRRY